MCFEILGMDILIDGNMKPYLLEVNHTPSFTTDTPLDKVIKKNLIRDALLLLDINGRNKVRIKIVLKNEF
jgi:tubulin polyglutamylase TTLL6/13